MIILVNLYHNFVNESILYTHIIIQANQISHVISKYTKKLLVLNQNIYKLQVNILRVILSKTKYDNVLNTNTSISSNVYQKKLFQKKRTSESWG